MVSEVARWLMSYEPYYIQVHMSTSDPQIRIVIFLRCSKLDQGKPLLYMENQNWYCILPESDTNPSLNGIASLQMLTKRNEFLNVFSQKPNSFLYDLPYFKLNLNSSLTKGKKRLLKRRRKWDIIFRLYSNYVLYKAAKIELFLTSHNNNNNSNNITNIRRQKTENKKIKIFDVHLWACSHYCAQARVPMDEVPRHWF